MPSDNLGQGQSVAVMGSGDSSTTVKDLAIFESEHGLPKVPVKVTDIPADGDFSDTGGNVEWELDTQSSTGMAPDVKRVHLYFAQHLIDPDAEADFAKWVDDPSGPKQANASFGECETTPANATLESTIPTQFNNNEDQNALYGTGAPDALEPVADQTLRQAVLEGRTLFAATGDTGSSCPVLVLGGELGRRQRRRSTRACRSSTTRRPSPYVVAVGGTVLYPDSDNTRGLEYPWPYTGGGQSFFIPAPSWQSGAPTSTGRACRASAARPNTSLGTCRGIPDVADESGDIATSSYDIYSDELGGASSEGGTSLASPLMMGMWARIQAASRQGHRVRRPAHLRRRQERHPGRARLQRLRGRHQRRLSGTARLGLRLGLGHPGADPVDEGHRQRQHGSDPLRVCDRGGRCPGARRRPGTGANPPVSTRPRRRSGPAGTRPSTGPELKRGLLRPMSRK